MSQEISNKKPGLDSEKLKIVLESGNTNMMLI